MGGAIRVLIVTSVYPRWQGDATPAFVQNIAQDLAESGYVVRVLAPHFKDCPKESQEKEVSVRRHTYTFPESLQNLCYEGGMIVRIREKKYRALLLPLFAISQFFAIKKELNHFRPHIIHTHSLLPQGWIATKALGKKKAIPHVVSSHGNDVFGLRGRFKHWKRQTSNSASTLVANSKATRDALAEISVSDKIEIIPASPNQTLACEPNAVDSLRREMNGIDKQLILFAGRLIPEKGIELLLDILSEILTASPSAKLVISGDGPLAEHVKTYIRNTPNPEAIEYLGWTSNERMPYLFTAVDVVVVPSQPQNSGWSEAHGLVAVEAMAAGKPVIASNLGGLSESICDQETGFLVEADDRSAWVETISNVLNASAEQQAIWGKAGRKRYTENYSREAALEKTKHLYQRLLKA